MEIKCDNCMLFRREECGGFGIASECDDYIGVPTISKEEMDIWPKKGDATVIRMQDHDEMKRRFGWYEKHK